MGPADLVEVELDLEEAEVGPADLAEVELDLEEVEVGPADLVVFVYIQS